MTRVVARVSTVLITGAVMLLSACKERDLFGPRAELIETVPAFAGLPRLDCTVNVVAKNMSCTSPAIATPKGVQADRIYGGQDVAVKLTSSGTSYNSGT